MVPNAKKFGTYVSLKKKFLREPIISLRKTSLSCLGEQPFFFNSKEKELKLPHGTI
jgi:hypothetical protein